MEQSLRLQSEYINGLRLHGATQPGERSIYFDTKDTIIQAYKKWDRSVNLLRAYIYLSTLEGDFSMKNTLTKELCQADATTCQKATTHVTVSGVVRDSLGHALPGVSVEVLGTEFKTTADKAGKYILTFDTQSPSVLRLQASSPKYMIGVKKINIVDTIRASDNKQEFTQNFTLTTPFETVTIDTANQTISGKNTEKTPNGFSIVTPYTKYMIPFDAIVKGKTPYKGKVTAMVFEFDRKSGWFLLDADAFDGIEWFATQLFVTYGMPYIIFTAEDGTRLDVLRSRPMTIATSKRETDEKTTKPEFLELYKIAYQDGLKQPGKYPITNKWFFDHGNLGLIPWFWVFDRMTGYWDNVGMRFASENPDAPYNVESTFYTVYDTAR